MKHSSKRFFGILLGLVLLLALVLTFSLSVCAFAEDVAYNVIIADGITYGGVEVENPSAKAGETVTLTAKPKTDCKLLKISAEAGKAETVADIIAAIGTAPFTNGDDTVNVSKDSLTIGSYSIAAEIELDRWSNLFFATDDKGNDWTFTLSGETGRITNITCSSLSDYLAVSGTSDYFLIKPVVLTPDTTNPNVYTFSMPAAPVTVSAEFEKLYPLWVGGTQVTSANSMGWEWSFDPDTATLVLRGATITGAYRSAAIYAESMDLTINVNSDSTVTGPDGGYGILVNSSDDVSRSITINGNGRLSVTGGSTCVKVSGSITVNGTLSAATGTTGNDDKYGVDGNIVINQGAVVAVTGTTRAIQGTVRNAIAGLGWTDVSGVGGETVIDVSEGQALNDYKKVQFPYYTVTFNTDGGEPEIMPVHVPVGSTIDAPTTPTKVNMAFTGWFDGTNRVTFPYTPPGDVTLTAQWTNAVASITRNGKTSYYATLQDAFNMAVDDDIVRMISDVMMRRDLFVRNKRITLDLNDHGLFINYSVIGYKILWVENSGSLTLTDNAENKTVHNIEMDMSGESFLPADKPLFRGRFPATGNGNKTIEVSGGYIAGGYASGGSGGGGVRVRSGSSFTMTGGTICACTTSMTDAGYGDSGGGVYVDADCRFTMTGGTIRDNNSYGNGGGVYVAGTFTMTGGTIQNNNSYGTGGGVYVNGGTFTMNGGTISGNTATNFGGGVCLENVSGSKFILKNGAVSGNTAGSFGGGVFIWPNGTLEMSGGEIGGATEVGQNTAAAGGGVTVWGGTLTMSGGTISGNTAASGGGVDVNGGTFTMDGENAAIRGNTATNFGGGVCLENVSGSKFILKNGAVSGNTAGSFGGGVFIWSNGTLEMSGGEISNNIATSLNGDGGGVTVWDGGALQMTGGSISGNSAPRYGGGVYVNGSSTFQMSDGMISGNTANRGGAVYSMGTFTMTGGEIGRENQKNTAVWGGGVCVGGGTFTMDGKNAAISGNTATEFGGGVCHEYGVVSRFILKNGSISGNTAGSFGGGVFIWPNGTLEMSGGEISDNIATSFDGGGVTVWDGGALQMTGGSISRNSAPRYGGGVYVNGNSTLQVSGKAFVTGNLQGEAENNVYLDTGKIVTVSGALEDTARIGVTMQTPGVFTSSTDPIKASDYIERFTSDASEYRLITEGNELALAAIQYPLYVGGKQVTSLNRNNVLAGDTLNDHKVSYTPAVADNPETTDVDESTPAILTLSGAAITSTNDSDSHEYAAIYAEGDLTIDVTEDSTVTGPDNVSGNSCGIRVGGSLTVTGTGTLTATGGTANIESYGVIAALGSVTVNGKLSATGGTLTAEGESYGVWARNGAITVNGTLTAEGGTATGMGNWSDSCGVSSGAVTVNATGKLTAAGGEAYNSSIGVIAAHGAVTVNGTMNAAGGTTNEKSYGVSAENGPVTVAATATLTATGDTRAIYGSVTNAIAGTGWTDAAGTEGKANIAVSTDGQTLEYKKVLFPGLPAATVTTAPTAKTLDYTGSAQELVTPGEATGGTMRYALGTDDQTAPTKDWNEAIPSKTDVGTYYVWYKVVGDENHNDTEPAPITVRIGERSLTITAAGASKTFDGTALTKNSYFTTGLAEGDKITSIKVTGSITSAGSSPNTASDAVIKNSAGEDVTDKYEITYRKGTLVVVKKPVLVKADDKTKVYDNDPATDPELTATVTGEVKGYPVSYTLSREAGEAVGSYKITVTAGKNPNYVLSVTDAELTITEAPVPVYGEPDFTLPGAIRTIEANAFEGGAMSIVYIPDPCTAIGAGAFKDCAKLTQIRLPKNCEIGNGAFTGCGKVYVFAPAGGTTESWCRGKDNIVFIGMDN